MSTESFTNITYDGLSFTNIDASEADTGVVNSFIPASQPNALNLGSSGVGMEWGGLLTAAYYANSSEVINLAYSVTDNNANQLLTGVSESLLTDFSIGTGVSLTAVEKVYDTVGNLLATDTWTLGEGSQIATFSTPQQTVNVTWTITMGVSSAGTSSSEIGFSAMQSGYMTETTSNTASIGDIVFLDANNTGVESSFNSGPGVAGVTVELLNGTGTSVLATTTTNASGGYLFSGLAAGAYEVKFVAPTGYTYSQEGVGGNPAVDSSANQTTGITAPVTLVAGQADMDVECGLVPNGSNGGGIASIGTTVWVDSNGDGLLDNSESGLGGVTVELLNGTGSSVIATQVTSSTGQYDFTNLSAGTYEVEVVKPSGYTFTQENAALTGGATINSEVSPTTGITAPIVLTSGETYVNANAGLENDTGSIGTTVWMDTNKDGLFDNGETGVGGVTVELLNSTGTSVLATQTTTQAGQYDFTGLVAGVYEVKVLAPTGDSFTTENAALTGGATINSEVSTSTGITAPITLAAGEQYTDANAGLVGGKCGISVIKLPCSMVVNQNGSVTYTFDVTNTGSMALTNVHIQDNIGTEDNPVYVTPTLVTQGTNGVLGAGQTWVYTETVNVSGTYCGTSDYNGGDSCGSGFGGGNNCGGNGGNGGYGGYSGYGGCGSSGNGGYDYSNYNCNSNGGYSYGGVSEYDVSCGNSGYSVCEDQSGSYNYSCDNNYNYSSGSANCVQGSGSGDCDYFYGCGGSSGCGSCGGSGCGGCGGDNGCGGGGCGGGGYSCGGYQYGPNICGMADTVTVTASCSTGTNSCTTTPTGGHLTGGCTAWLSTTFKPTSCANGATYNFTGIKCTITGGGYSSPEHVDCPNATITFSSSCKTPTTTYNQSTNTWCTTLPANSNPGNCFVTGIPVGIDSGCNLSTATVTWSIGESNNNCGASSVNWDGTCTGYSSFGAGSANDCTTWNNIGVKSCDNLGSGSDCAGTPVNDYSSSNCGDTAVCTTQDQDANTCGSSSSSSCATVSATDTKEVQVLGCNSDVTVGGNAPTGSLSSLYGAAQTLEFTYTPGNTVSADVASIGAVTGTNSNSMAFMEISNNANPFASGATIYFEGAVETGEKIYADATTNVLTNTPVLDGQFSQTSGAEVYAYVFTSQSAFLKGSAPVQTMAYNTSGSQAMHLGDTVGSLQLIGYVGASGGHLVS